VITPAKLLLGPTAATTDAYFFSGLQPDSVYTLYAADRCGGFTSVTKSFSPLRPLIRTSFSLQPCPGDAVSLSLPLSAGSVSYQWAFNGTDISGATGNIYNINPVALSDSGNYTVRMAVTGCSVLSAPMVLNPGACGMAIPLPLQLLRFTGTLNNRGQAQLQWQLADPQPGTKMEVLFSTDGAQYTTAGTLWPQKQETRFSFVQEQVLTETGHFRLRITGTDGTEQYSHNITLQADRKGTDAIQISPVPFNDQLQVHYKADADAIIKISLRNAAGQPVYNKAYKVQAGNNSLQLAGLNELPAGTYLLELAAPGGQIQYRTLSKW
jgi:hypothetical protein